MLSISGDALRVWVVSSLVGCSSTTESYQASSVCVCVCFFLSLSCGQRRDWHVISLQASTNACIGEYATQKVTTPHHHHHHVVHHHQHRQETSSCKIPLQIILPFFSKLPNKKFSTQIPKSLEWGRRRKIWACWVIFIQVNWVLFFFFFTFWIDMEDNKNKTQLKIWLNL